MLAKVIFVITMMVLPFAAHAEDKDAGNELRLSAGGHGLASSYALEYERRMGSQGWSVFGQFTSRRAQTDQTAQTPEQWLVGVGAPIHLIDHTSFDVFIAPEIAIMHVKNNLTDGTDITTGGPGLNIGTLYAFNPMWSLGLEFVTYTNWFNDKVASTQTGVNLALGFNF